MSRYTNLTTAPPDPILGITEIFKADPRPDKVNLGIGVYQDDTGKLPLMECVRRAEERLTLEASPRGYLPQEGDRSYDALTRSLVFGADSPQVAAGKIVTVQALGGTGALKLGADFWHPLFPDATVLISQPTWDNHMAVFGSAGFRVARYRYYDAAHRGIDYAGMMDDLSAAAPGTIVVLHTCCHNPTGYDLSLAQWGEVLDLVTDHGLLPFFDLAYQGLAESLDADPYPVREAARRGLDFCCASSNSKNLGLYGERIGALSVSCADADEGARVVSQVKLSVRANYSNPPTHGEAIAATVLGDPELRALWTDEVAAMRDRIKAMRIGLVAALQAAGLDADLGFITAQRGMFSYSGLTPEQMTRLRDEWGVYGVIANGRLCVAALNPGNLDYVAQAIKAVW